MFRVWCHVGASFLRGRPRHSAATGATHGDRELAVALNSVTVLQCNSVTLNNAATQRSIFTAPGSSWRQGGNQLPTEGYSWTENQ